MPERLPFPTAEELHEAQMEELKLSLFFGMPGRIQSYDADHQVADIVPQIRHPAPRSDGGYDFEDLPVLPDVPIVWPRMGKWFIAMSVEPGDAVQLFFDSPSPGAWRRQAETGNTGLDRIREVMVPATMQRHHLSNAVAVPGLDIWHRALRHAPGQWPPTAPQAGITFGSDLDDGLRVSIKGDGSLTVTIGNDVALKVDADRTVHLGTATGNALALAAATDAIVSSLKTAIAGWTPVPNDGGASLKSVIAGWSPASVAASKVNGA